METIQCIIRTQFRYVAYAQAPRMNPDEHVFRARMCIPNVRTILSTAIDTEWQARLTSLFGALPAHTDKPRRTISALTIELVVNDKDTRAAFVLAAQSGVAIDQIVIDLGLQHNLEPILAGYLYTLATQLHTQTLKAQRVGWRPGDTHWRFPHQFHGSPLEQDEPFINLPDSLPPHNVLSAVAYELTIGPSSQMGRLYALGASEDLFSQLADYGFFPDDQSLDTQPLPDGADLYHLLSLLR